MNRGGCWRLVLAVAALLLASCAAGSKPSAPAGSAAGSAAYIPAHGSVAVLALARTPEVNIEGFSGGRIQGFATGMENTFVACFQTFGQGACMNSGCGALVLFLLGTCGTLGVVGGLAGALDTEADAGKRAAALSIDRALNTAPAQLQLRDRIVAAARRQGTTLAALDLAPQAGGEVDYGAIQSLGIDTVLEVELTRVGTAGPGGNAPSRLYMEARARLVRVSDRGELASGQYRVQGPSYSAWEWRAEGGARLLEGFQNAYGGLAERIYEAHFRP